ncbi:mediator complex, subunit Med10 [Pseudomassariella vexata]|uniref:Mediator of RNA polymerase II transcription subunit 10 n=1 Tax=Pseudomassariella vexata TaxID=1141098 RepID=A0A1Y2EDU6_9PEZI|nr:mediator complex, subunit Med10 [Pseudomassariella vexata]ORY69753.1 mediator complex, subunit Med10 [Pseudomassariella vexata]
MAPVPRVDHDALELQLKETIQSLYQILVQVTAYDSSGTTTSRPSRDVLANELRNLDASLQTVHRTASVPDALPRIPPELIQYVENGRNPDIYTREFVELVRRNNQMMKGKQDAFASFRDVLAGEMDKAMPELREDTARVLAATGGAGAEAGAPTGS